MKTKKRIEIALALVLVMLLLAGCSAGSSQNAGDYAVSEEPAMEPSADAVRDEMGGFSDADLPTEQKLIKEGHAELYVEDARAAGEEIRTSVTAMGGFVSNESQYVHVQDGREYYTVTLQLRLPDTAFSGLLEDLEARYRVQSKQINVLDVTEEYIDLEARIRNLTEEEKRFVAIFDQAETVEDMLAVERELARLRTEIESLQGRFRYLQNRVSFGTLTLRIEEERIKTAGFEGLSFTETLRRIGASFTQGVYGFFRFVGTSLIRLAYLAPFLLFGVVFAGGAWLIVRRSRSKKGDQ